VTGFNHEAVLYAGDKDFVDRVARFLLDGISAGEPSLVMTNARKISALRERLGGADEGVVEYRDMQIVGANPACIIPAWDDFALKRSRAGAARLRGVGEPIWAGRTALELEECHWHEALINRAFATLPGFWLICPYDVDALAPSVVDEARHTHPVVTAVDEHSVGGSSKAGEALSPNRPLASPLPQPPDMATVFSFDRERLGELRSVVAGESARGGLTPHRVDDLVVAVNEVATNSVVHGGGDGIASLWRDADSVVCEIRDAGVVTDPLADRTLPSDDPSDARGLWTANRLCDLVQLRSSRENGTEVRLHMRTGVSREVRE
jgi:anti-sigma regulatory factor (Ser/Thr protein kinase)